MKKMALAGLLLAAVGSVSAQVYVGGGFGPSHVNIDCPAILGKCDTSDTGYKVYGGYKLNPSVALEVAYVDFGKAKFTGGSFATDGFVINAAFRHNFTRELNGVARLGVATLDTKLSGPRVIGGSQTDSGTKIYVGLGAEYALQKNLKVTVGADFTSAEFQGDSGAVRLFSLGAQYDF